VENERPRDLYNYLREAWLDHRFDNIAGAAQHFTETLTAELVRNIAAETGVHRFVLSGGIAMNVKMNKVIGELDCVHELFVAGSGGDESLSIGGCYVLNQENGTNAALEDLYLGNDISAEFSTYDWSTAKAKFDVRSGVKPDEVAPLLIAGETVATVRGRAEFGARALGNRSILADPSKREAIIKINEAIKNRDFWMPFALSIMEEHACDYIHNPKGFAAPFMATAFDTKPETYRKIEAGTHPYDKSVRPQFVSKDRAPQYHALIESFRKQSGIPALLNTSFNLHGEPIVDSIADAMRTFEFSGLDHLYVQDDVLVSKRK
jgi:carbamoyltransferase